MTGYIDKKVKNLLKDFYSAGKQKPLLTKKERKPLEELKKSDNYKQINISNLPAVEEEIKKYKKSGKNPQGGIFTEAVFSQNLADIENLDKFEIADEKNIPDNISLLLNGNKTKPRYFYSKNNSEYPILIEAGSAKDTDSTFINAEKNIIKIEYKDPHAKISEIDLGKVAYSDESGGKIEINKILFENAKPNLVVFQAMLNDAANLNFFELEGSNFNSFNENSVEIAITNNYQSSKKADVYMTENDSEELLMMPVEDVRLWSKSEGEIRPAGRNSTSLWTPKHFFEKVSDLGGEIGNNFISIPLENIKTSSQRGGISANTSRYKIGSLYFIKSENVVVYNDEKVSFDIKNVRQLIPTITAKIDFSKTSWESLENKYSGVSND